MRMHFVDLKAVSQLTVNAIQDETASRRRDQLRSGSWSDEAGYLALDSMNTGDAQVCRMRRKGAMNDFFLGSVRSLVRSYAVNSTIRL